MNNNYENTDDILEETLNIFIIDKLFKLQLLNENEYYNLQKKIKQLFCRIDDK